MLLLLLERSIITVKCPIAKHTHSYIYFVAVSDITAANKYRLDKINLLDSKFHIHRIHQTSSQLRNAHYIRKNSLKLTFNVISRCRITEWLKLEWTSGGHRAQLACSSRAIYSQLPRTTSKGLLTSPEMETPQSLWAACAKCSSIMAFTKQVSVVSEVMNVSWCSGGVFCAHCLWSCHIYTKW